MTEPFNILITAASRRVAMIRSFKDALANMGMRGRVIVTDTDRLSPGLRFCDRYHIVPLSSSPDYIPSIMNICRKEKIRLLVPTIDEELELFGRHKPDFRDIGVIPLVSDESVGKICGDKYLTARFFEKHGLPFAETWLPSQIDYDMIEYPLFIKPRRGRGSIGAHPIKNEKELRFFSDYVDDPVIQRYLTGKEYTIDALIGQDGRVLSIVPRERLVIRAGVCDRGKTERNHGLIDIGKTICEKLGAVGPINLQCKVENGGVCFFEVNPRFSGAIQLTVAAGADFFSMILQDTIGRNPKPAIGEFQGDFLMLSYEESLFEKRNGHDERR